MAAEQPHDGTAIAAERRLPPITELSVAAMILVVIGGIYLAASFPPPVRLAPAVALLIAAAVFIVSDIVALSRLRRFAWWRFRVVFGWTLLAYLVIAGMIEYVFVLDQTRGAPLLLVTLMLAVYAVDIPLLLAFSVARYQALEPAAGE